jgi:hypothetical protein
LGISSAIATSQFEVVGVSVVFGRLLRRGEDARERECVPQFSLEITVVGALDLACFHQDLGRCAVNAFLEAFMSSVLIPHATFIQEPIPVHDILTAFLYVQSQSSGPVGLARAIRGEIRRFDVLGSGESEDGVVVFLARAPVQLADGLCATLSGQ